MITVSYDGSSFNGWQLQPDNPLITIQGLLNYELSKFTGEDINIRASGRTDSGVHATCQTADFFCNKNLDLKNFPKEINRKLCDSVRITGICRVRDDFHSRKNALSKTYSYFVSLSDKPDVFYHRFVYTPCMPPLNVKPNMCSSPDIEFMKKCSRIFIGKHDFSAFTKPKQLFAYFGLDPAVKQSGKFEGTKVQMSKRGSAIARRVIHVLTLQSISTSRTGEAKNPVLRDYYLKKCESKPKLVAMGAVSHKVCNMIFAILRDNKPFEIVTPQEHIKQYNAAKCDEAA